MAVEARSQCGECQHWPAVVYNRRIETSRRDEFKRLKGVRTYLHMSGHVLIAHRLHSLHDLNVIGWLNKSML